MTELAWKDPSHRKRNLVAAFLAEKAPAIFGPADSVWDTINDHSRQRLAVDTVAACLDGDGGVRRIQDLRSTPRIRFPSPGTYRTTRFHPVQNVIYLEHLGVLESVRPLMMEAALKLRHVYGKSGADDYFDMIECLCATKYSDAYGRALVVALINTLLPYMFHHEAESAIAAEMDRRYTCIMATISSEYDLLAWEHGEALVQLPKDGSIIAKDNGPINGVIFRLVPYATGILKMKPFSYVLIDGGKHRVQGLKHFAAHDLSKETMAP